MATIGSAGNADTACHQVLMDKGYCIKAYSGDRLSFVAEKDGESFAAEQLLPHCWNASGCITKRATGTVAIIEKRPKRNRNDFSITGL